MGKLIHFPLAAVRQQGEPQALNKIEVRGFHELAFYASHGYRVKVHERGCRVFMVREVCRAT